MQLTRLFCDPSCRGSAQRRHKVVPARMRPSVFFALGLTAVLAGCGASGNVDAMPGVGATTPPANNTPVAGNTVREVGPAVAPGGRGMAVLPMSGCTVADYYADTIIGSNHFSLLIDSGSTTTAVAANNCSSCDVNDRYNTATGTSLRTPISTEYGDGSQWSGTIYQDGMAMGTVASPETSKVQVAFAAIANQNHFFSVGSCSATSEVVFDGILGLGPDELLERGSTSFLTALNRSRGMANDAFAVLTCGVGGKLMVGGYDTSTVTEQPFFVPRVQTNNTMSYYYSIDLVQVLLGGSDVGVSKASLGPIVVDNGTSFMSLPSALYRAMVAKLNANTAFAANFSSQLFVGGNCGRPAKGLSRAQLDAALPRMDMVFTQSATKTATLSVAATNSYLVPVSDSDGTIYYCPSISESDGGIAIMGNAAMREHVVIFDRANDRVGFATGTGCDDAVAYGGN